MDKRLKALKTARILGIIGSGILVTPGYLFLLAGLASLAIHLTKSPDRYTQDFGIGASLAGAVALVVGLTGTMSGLLAIKKPLLAGIMQFILAFFLSILVISSVLWPASGDRTMLEIWLLWPGLYWVGGTLLLNYGKSWVNNNENMPYRRVELKMTRNIGLIGSSLALLFSLSLIAYQIILVNNGTAMPSGLGPLSVMGVSLLLFVTGLLNLGVSFLIIAYPKWAGIVLIISSVIQTGWLLLTFLASWDDWTENLGLVWILWVPFQLFAAYKAIKLSQLK